MEPRFLPRMLLPSGSSKSSTILGCDGGVRMLFYAYERGEGSECGEVYFDESEVDSIQDIIRSVEDQTAKLTAVA